MNQAHAHLLLNHLPILGSLFGFLTLGVGLLRKNASLIQWGLIVFAGVMVLANPAFLTGEGAEEVVEDLPGISQTLIKEHEEAADLSLWSAIGLGILSTVSLAMGAKKNRSAPVLIKAAFGLSSVVVGLMLWTGYIGGRIRHSEFQSKAMVSPKDIQGLSQGLVSCRQNAHERGGSGQASPEQKLS